MGLMDKLFFGPKPAPMTLAAEPARHRFAIGSDYETYMSLVGNSALTGRVSRAEAMSVPAVKRARDLYAALAMLSIHAYNAKGDKVPNPLLIQPEKNEGLVRSVSFAQLLDDLFFEGKCLWKVMARTFDGFPSIVKRVKFGEWTQDTETGKITIAGVKQPDKDMILFVSGADPILVAAAGPIRALIKMEQAGLRYVEHPEMSEYFQPAEGQEPTPEQIEEFLSDYAAARNKSTVGFIPGTLVRNELRRMTADEIQLVGAREFAISEVARLSGVPSSWLDLNITTREYTNSQEARRDWVDLSASLYLKPIEDRLTLNDVCPNGQWVRFNLDSFMRANTADRMKAYIDGKKVGAYTTNEIRDLENRPPLTAAEKAELEEIQ